MERTLEQNMFDEAIKILVERRKQQEDYVVSNPLDRDEYLHRVGQIKAFNDIEDDFVQLHNTFFPST